MRTLSMLLSFLTAANAALSSQETHDYRLVNGVTVDLAPVHKWLSNREGNRPLKHWKQLRIVELKQSLSAWEKCLVKNEAGDEVEVLIANLPSSTKSFFTGLNQQYAEILRLRATIESDTRKIRLLDSQVPEAAFGEISWVNSMHTQRAQLETWKANVESMKERLAALQSDYDAKLAESPERLTIVAMFSGHRYADLEIWDCGKLQAVKPAPA